MNAPSLNSGLTGRYRGKFVAPGKFFPPPYSHDETNPNPNPDPSPNPNPNFNPNPYCCMWELFSGGTNFPLHQYSIYLSRRDEKLS